MVVVIRNSVPTHYSIPIYIYIITYDIHMYIVQCVHIPVYRYDTDLMEW